MLNVLSMVGRSWRSCASATSRVATFSPLSFLLVSSSCHRLFASCFSDSSIERHACKSASERNEFASHTRLYRSFVFLRTFLKGVKVDRPVIYKVSPFSRTRYIYIYLNSMRLINFCIDSNKIKNDN